MKAREELERKYGGLTRRVRNEMHDIRRYPKITENDTIRLEEYSDKVTSLVTCLKEKGSEGDLSEVSAFYMLVSEKLHHSYIKSYHRWLSTLGRQDSLEIFAEWLAEEAMWEKKAKEATASNKEPDEPKTSTRRGARKTYSSRKQVNGAISRLQCWVCQAEHATESCAELQSWDVARRNGFCKNEGICFRCLAGKHRGVNCRRFPGCAVEGCGGTHHSLLHASGGGQISQDRGAETSRQSQRRHKLSHQAKEFVSRTQEATPRSTHGSSHTSSTSFNTASQDPEKRGGKIAF